MNERSKLSYVVLVLAVAALIASAACISVLYRAAVEGAHAQLSGTAKTQARLIESVARYDLAQGASASSHEIPNATLDQVVDSFSRYEGIGRSGEFLLGRRDNRDIVFLARQRSDDPAQPHPTRVAFDSADAQPMHRALSGQSGTMIGRDYRGREVLAAYEPVGAWNLGVVAKFDLDEVRAPFVRTGAVVGGMVVLTVLLCALLIRRATDPIIRRAQENEARLRLALRASNTGLWDWDIRTNRVYFSPEWKQQLGYEDAEFPNRFEEWERRVHPEDLERILAESKSYLAHPEAKYEGEYRIRHKDGSYRWVLSRADVFMDEKGAPYRMLGARLDITERKRTEQAVRELAERLQAVVSNTPVVLFALDRDGVFTLSEGRGLGALGLRAGELVGRSVFEVYRDSPRMLENIRRALGGDSFNTVTEVAGLSFEVWYSPLHDAQGALTGVIGVATDITERRLAENSFRRAQELLSQTERLAHIGSWEWDLRTDRVHWSPEMYRQYQIDPANAPSRTFELAMSRIHPEDQPGFREKIEHALKVGRFEPTDYRLLLPDGTLRLVNGEGEVVYDDDHRPVKMYGFVQDITERKRIESTVREREALLATVMEALPIGVWITDRQGQIVSSNEAGKRIWAGARYVGIDQYGEYKGWWADTGKPIAPEEWALARAVTKGETSINEVVDIECFDGTRKTILNSAMPLRAPDGSITGAIVVNEDITEQRRAQVALRQSEDRLRKTFEASAMIISVSRIEDGRFLDVNPAFLRTGGWTREEVIGRTSRDLNIWIGGEDRARLIERIRREGTIHDVELAFRMKSGEVRHLLCGIERIRIEDVDCLLLVGQDITERKKAETQMQKLSHALEQTADAVLITDRNGVIEYVNPMFEQVTGYTSAEAVGRTPNLLRSGRQGAGFFERMWKTILIGEVFNDVFINRRKDGSLYYEEKTITPLKGTDGEVSHFVATGKDITERMQTQERLAYMAQHDPLTELPNRALLLDRLKQSLAGARWRERRVAVLFVDLDRFKVINDTLGHETGDRLLRQLAERIRHSVREGDTVARFGGDEFVILLDAVDSEDDVTGVAQKVLQALSPPFQIDHHLLYVTASIGVSLFPNDGDDATTLLKNADIAMYRAKELGKNTYQFYSADMSARAFERLTLESNLRRALDHGEFRLHYQPQVDVETGAIVGVEALLRWQHPEFGLVMPADFIPLLEETGLIVPAGEWVLQTACAQLAAWHAQGWRRLRLSVNLSPRQFQGQDLTAAVRRALDLFDGDPAGLELEITEGVLVRHAPATVETLEALNALGVRMAVDDFGTGYSSLSYLRRLPIDTLKIDRAFVRDIPHDPDDSAITAAIVALAQSLKLEMTAEGVENEAQRDFLRAQGCRVMQGYFFSRPQPPEDVTRLLQAQKPR